MIYRDGVMVRCEFNQAKPETICKKWTFASFRIELADTGQLTVTRVPVLTREPDVS